MITYTKETKEIGLLIYHEKKLWFVLKCTVFIHNCTIACLEGTENKRRLQTSSIDNAWSNKNNSVELYVSYATTYIIRCERL